MHCWPLPKAAGRPCGGAGLLSLPKKKDSSDKVGDFHVPWDTQAGQGGGRGKGHSVRQVGKKRHGWTGKVCKCFNWGFGNFSIC